MKIYLTYMIVRLCFFYFGSFRLFDLYYLLKAAFRALVEENVKANVTKIAKSAVIREVLGSFFLIDFHSSIADI